MWMVVKMLYLAIGAVASVALALAVWKNKRRLDRRVEEFRQEMEENQGPPLNPYLALAELYAEDERKNQEARKKRKR